MLKAKLKTLDGLDEGLKGLYVERDGMFHLAVEGMVGKEKLDEFRTTNTDLAKNLKAVEDKLAGVDLDEYQALKKANADIEQQKLKDAGEFDKLLAQRVEQMQADHKAKMDEVSTANTALTAKLEKLTIVGEATRAGNQLGVLPGAVDDLIGRVRSVYTMDGENAVPKDANGSIIYSASGKGPMSIEEWIQGNLVDQAKHLFAPNTGGGPKNTGNGSAGGKPTISRQGFDAMSQTQRSGFAKEGGTISG